MALNYLIPCRLLLFWFKRKAFLACQQFLWKWNSRWEGIIQARETSRPTNGSHLTLLQSIQRKNFLGTLLPLYLRGGVNDSSPAWNPMDKRFHQTPLEQQQRARSQQSSVLQGAFFFSLKEDGCLCSKAFNLIQIFCASQFESPEKPLPSA